MTAKLSCECDLCEVVRELIEVEAVGSFAERS